LIFYNYVTITLIYINIKLLYNLKQYGRHTKYDNRIE